MERDEVVMVEVVTEAFDREWWRAFAATFETRFAQESIHVRAIAFRRRRDRGSAAVVCR